MADGLEIELTAPVRSVTQDETGVTIKTDGSEFFAAHAIIAVPPMLCAQIDFNQISPSRRVLQERMPQTAMLKFHVAYDRPFWRARGYSGLVVTDSLPLSMVLESTDDPPMLAGFAQGENALKLAAMSAAERQQAIVTCLVDLFGPDASEPLAYAEKDWLADKWARGYVGAMAPGVLMNYGGALREPCGRIHWAGSEAAREWLGTMEGALESGARAAGEVLARS
jgi:monoamine oxidase